MLVEPFMLPNWFDYLATFFFAMAGTLLAVKKGYDIVGVFTVAFASAMGGGLIRDGLFLQQGPPVVATNGAYLLIVLLGVSIGIWFHGSIPRLQTLIKLFDAVGLGAYAIVGIEKSAAIGLSLPAMILIGVVNAVGGGIFRDVLTREEPMVFRPGQFYVAVALVGCLAYLALKAWGGFGTIGAGITTILLTFSLRVLAIRFNWQTRPLMDRIHGPASQEEEP